MILNIQLKQTARVHSKDYKFPSVFIFAFIFFLTVKAFAQVNPSETFDTPYGAFMVIRMPFNSPYADYGTVYRNNELVFVSARIASIVRYTSENNETLTDMYVTQLKNGKWRSAASFSSELNSKFNEGPLCFDKTATTIYFNRSDNKGRLKIMKAEFLEGKWQNIQELPINNEKYSLAHPALSPDGSALYFSSDMPGGLGGKDLYVSFLKDGKWSAPENLGESVNSPGDELFPFVTSDNNYLYFSSDGHGGSGKLDILRSEKQEGGWQNIYNPGPPFNSAEDDFAYISDSTGLAGYFSSNRINSEDDIFSFKLAEPEFINPDTLKLNSYCLSLFEETTALTDTLPYVYEWNLGDGVIRRGKEIHHCFPAPGDYKVCLNILDTLTGLVHKNEAEYLLELRDHEQLYINSADTVMTGEPISFDASGSYLPGFTIKNYYWEYGDGYRSRGLKSEHIFTRPGTFFVKLGSEVVDPAGTVSNKSVVKKILVRQRQAYNNLSYEK
jgi:hypothetical protein